MEVSDGFDSNPFNLSDERLSLPEGSRKNPHQAQLASDMKKPLLSLLAAILALGAAAGVGAAPGFDLAAARSVIEANNRRFTEAHVRGDQATIDAMFTWNAKCLPPGADPVIGRAAIAQLTKEYLQTGVSEFREETTDFYGDEHLLIDQGSYVMVYGKEKTRETGKYLNVWKKEDGVWKIHCNIWNTNAPDSPTK